jgi:hypothetical protein
MALGGWPETTFSNFKMCPASRASSSANRWDTGQNTALHLTCCQDPVHNVARMDTGRKTAPVCLCKVVQSPTPTLNRVKPSLFGLAAEDWRGPGTLTSFKITSEEPRVTIQVAGRPQTPTWCYLTSRVSFILHRSPWWGWMVSSTSQKGKTVLFIDVFLRSWRKKEWFFGWERIL